MSSEHHHSLPTHRWRLAVAFGITASILLAEVIGAVVTGSLALLVDAGHMLTDAGGLLMALVAASLMVRPATTRMTWGWRRVEILAAGIQATILLGVGFYALIEGIQRLISPLRSPPPACCWPSASWVWSATSPPPRAQCRTQRELEPACRLPRGTQ